MRPTDDDRLRTHFEMLRDQFRASAPDFRTVVQQAKLQMPASQRPRAGDLTWLAAAAMLLLSLGIVLYQSGTRAPGRTRGNTPARASTVPTISSWTSPTASLLRTSSRELLAPPPLLTSVLDGATRPALPRKGDLP